MIHLVDGRMREEASRFSLVFTCRRCAHFAEPDERCSLGYPAEPHKDCNLDSVDQMAFCKTFELA